MHIAIIGIGNVGRAVAGSGTRAGHTAILSARQPEHAPRVAQETGAQAAASNRAAVEGAAVAILAVPYPAVGEALDELGDALAGKILVGPTNRVNPADPGSVLDGASAAEQIQARARGARLVTAFNTALASRQADPVVDGITFDGYVAGDDERSRAAVLGLVKSLGFRPIDAGPLAMARVLEGMALFNISLNVTLRPVKVIATNMGV